MAFYDDLAFVASAFFDLYGVSFHFADERGTFSDHDRASDSQATYGFEETANERLSGCNHLLQLDAAAA